MNGPDNHVKSRQNDVQLNSAIPGPDLANRLCGCIYETNARAGRNPKYYIVYCLSLQLREGPCHNFEIIIYSIVISVLAVASILPLKVIIPISSLTV